MSLLDRGQGFEPCTVYPQETVTDPDGNAQIRASATGVDTSGWFQIQNQSGTASRRAEQDTEGFTTEQVYSVRFTRAFNAEHGELGNASKLVWRGQKWSFFGKAQRYTSSRRTAHIVYSLRRA